MSALSGDGVGGVVSCLPQVMTEVPQDEVELSLLKTGLGSVTQSDVEAAALAEASIFAFNVGSVPPDVKVGRASDATPTLPLAAVFCWTTHVRWVSRSWR